MFGLALEGLPGLADDVLVSGDRAFGRHAQRVRLNADFGGELTLALGRGFETDGSVEVFVAGVVGESRRRLARLGDGPAVELPAPCAEPT